MIYSLLFTTFTTVFLAELGDKTQIATIAISGTSKKPLAVFLGSSLALISASLLGVLIGGSLSSLVPETLIKLIAAGCFLILGTRVLLPSIQKKDQ